MIALRTAIVKRPDHACSSCGAGIVYDSDPEAELMKRPRIKREH